MSVTLTSIALVVHIFGFITTSERTDSYSNMTQCINSLVELSAKYIGNPRYEVYRSKDKTRLKIVDNSDKAIFFYDCEDNNT